MLGRWRKGVPGGGTGLRGGPPEAGARVCEDPCGYRRAEERWAGGDLREATAGRPDAARPCQPF